MDREEAKFILSSFRPCGSDSADPAFQDALRIAIEDQELSEWLVKERSFDRDFGECISRVQVPQDLKDQLYTLFDSDLGESTEEDLSMMGALVMIEPPAKLRQEILSAMQVASVNKDSHPGKKKQNKIVQYFFPMAIAAMVAIATFLGVFIPKKGNMASSFDLAQASTEVVSSINSGEVVLDLKENNFLKTVSWAESQNIPTAANLPDGVKDLNVMGCKKIEVMGQPASLTCFHTNADQMMHLIVMQPENIDEFMDEIPLSSHVKNYCKKCPHTGCSVARWHDGEKIYVLVSKTVPLDEFQEVF